LKQIKILKYGTVLSNTQRSVARAAEHLFHVYATIAR
jgi:hypothetical protein